MIKEELLLKANVDCTGYFSVILKNNSTHELVTNYQNIRSGQGMLLYDPQMLTSMSHLVSRNQNHLEDCCKEKRKLLKSVTGCQVKIAVFSQTARSDVHVLLNILHSQSNIIIVCLQCSFCLLSGKSVKNLFIAQVLVKLLSLLFLIQ